MDQIGTSRDINSTSLVLVVLISFTIVFNLGNLIHELGHLLILHLQGGYTTKLVFHPFLPTYVVSSPVPKPGWSDIGGWLFNIGIGSIFTILTWRNSRVYLFPLRIWGPLALIIEGFNMLLSPLSSGSDGERFAEFIRFPIGILSMIGIIMIMTGLILYNIQLHRLGITIILPFIKRLTIVILGNSIYFIITFCYLIVFAPSSDFSRVIINLVAVVLISFLAIATQKLSLHYFYHAPEGNQI